MNTAEILSIGSLVVSLLLGLLVFVTNRRANRTSEKKLTIEEQALMDAREATVAEQRLEELNRLLPRVSALEAKVKELEKDRDVLSTLIASLRRLILAFVQRVEEAWENGHEKPTLTREELELLERTEPLYRHPARTH
jgi:hypothetical protein